MKTLVILSLLLALSPGEPEKPMTMKRALQIVPRPLLEPAKSLIPDQRPETVDTLDTSDPKVKIALCSNGTWHYMKDPVAASEDTVFTRNWDSDKVNPYRVEYKDLPLRATLWLVDSASNFTCPRTVKVYSPFGRRRSRMHTGVDLPLQTGTPVYAAFDGKVRMSKYMRGYGNMVIIRHECGLETIYGHLSKRNVEAGDWVSSGDVIGLGGSTGRSTGPHLHFETRYDGFAFDPQWLIDFENAVLRQKVYVLKRKVLTPGAKYVPQSDDEEEEIYLTEEQERAEAERIAKELAAAQYYTIRSGDTLGKIALKYGTSVNAICKLNGITPRTTLRIGRKLRVK